MPKDSHVRTGNTFNVHLPAVDNYRLRMTVLLVWFDSFSVK
jgi:hypothetical protein